MNDYHSSSSSSYSSPSSSPSPMLGTPSPLYDDSSHSEKDFFSNFSCCGLTLADMHQLVEHYEEAHALVFGSDGKPLYPAFQSATSPHPSPLTSLAVGYPQPSSYPYPKNPLAYTHTESSSALGVGFPDLEEPYNPFGFDDYGFISPPHHHAHPYPSSTSTTAYNYDHPPLLRINTSFPRPSISSDTSSTSSSSPPPLTATTTTYSSAPSPLSVSWSASSSVYNSPDLKPSGLVDDHHHHRHHPQAKCLPPALLSLPPQISLRRPQPLPLKSQVSSLRVADSGKTRSMPVQIVEPYGLPPSISRRKSTFGGGLVSQPPQAQTQVQRPQVQRPQQPQPQQPQVQQPQQTQAQRPQQTQAQQQTKTKDQEKDGSGGGVGPHRTVHARDSAHSSPYMHGVGGHGKVQTQTQVQTTQTGRPTQAQTTQAGRPIQVQTTQAGLQMHLTPAGLQMQMTHPGLQKQIQAMQAGRPMQMQTGRQMLVQTGRPASTVGKKKKDGREKAFKCPHPGCTKTYLNPNGLKYHLEKGTCSIDPEFVQIMGLPIDDVGFTAAAIVSDSAPAEVGAYIIATPGSAVTASWGVVGEEVCGGDGEKEEGVREVIDVDEEEGGVRENDDKDEEMKEQEEKEEEEMEEKEKDRWTSPIALPSVPPVGLVVV